MVCCGGVTETDKDFEFFLALVRSLLEINSRLSMLLRRFPIPPLPISYTFIK